MADSNDEKGKRPGARPAVPPFRGPAGASRPPLTPPAGTGPRPPLAPPAGMRAPFASPPAGARPARPITPAPLAWGRLPEAEREAAEGQAAKAPSADPIARASGIPETLPDIASFAPDATAEAITDSTTEAAASEPEARAPLDESRAEVDASDFGDAGQWGGAGSFDAGAGGVRELPAELAMPGSVPREIELPEREGSPFDTTDAADDAFAWNAAPAKAPADPGHGEPELEEKVGLYGEPEPQSAPLAEDVVPPSAGEPAIEAMPPELARAYPSLQDTQSYEVPHLATPESPVEASGTADAWDASAARDADPGARERAARILERTAGRVRAGEIPVADLSADASDAAALAAVLAALLGGTREAAG